MKAVPYLVLEGTVVGHRTLEVPAKPPEAYSDGSGRMTKGSQARTVHEVGVNVPALVNGDVVDDVRVLASVAWPDPQIVAFPAKGDVVRLAVEPLQIKKWNGSRFMEWVGLRYRGTAPEHRASITDRPARTVALATGS